MDFDETLSITIETAGMRLILIAFLVAAVRVNLYGCSVI